MNCHKCQNEMPDDAIAYFAGRMRVDPLSYAAAIKALKSAMNNA